MLKHKAIIVVPTLLCGLVLAQSTTRPKYMDRAAMEHKNSVVTLFANHSIPLFQAVTALREEYGWKVNWESAPGYSRFDLVDDTAPKRRLEHPGVKGVTRPTGGAFSSTFPEPRDPSAAGGEGDVVAKVIEDYNATDSPGKYVLLRGPEGDFTVVGSKVRDGTGALEEVRPLLETPIVIGKETRSIEGTLYAIFDALRLATGKKVMLAVASSSLLRNTPVTVGGDELVPARELVRQALAGSKRPLQYDLLYNADVPSYGLNISMASKVQVDLSGRRRLIPVDRYH